MQENRDSHPESTFSAVTLSINPVSEFHSHLLIHLFEKNLIGSCQKQGNIYPRLHGDSSITKKGRHKTSTHKCGWDLFWYIYLCSFSLKFFYFLCSFINVLLVHLLSVIALEEVWGGSVENKTCQLTFIEIENIWEDTSPNWKSRRFVIPKGRGGLSSASQHHFQKWLCDMSQCTGTQQASHDSPVWRVAQT